MDDYTPYSCPFPDCSFTGRTPRSVSSHWAHRHEGPCPLTTETKLCLHCHQPFTISKAELRHRPMAFCSRECWSKAIAVEYLCTCYHCGKTFSTADADKARHVKYCSKACAVQAQHGRRVSRRLVNCENCNQPFEEIAYRIEHGRRYCSHRCASQAKDHGMTKLQETFRDLEKSMGWQTTVLKRDGFRCILCGIRRRRGVNLHVHHVVAVAEIMQSIKDKTQIRQHPLFANTENGQTLCSDCHALQHSQRLHE